MNLSIYLIIVYLLHKIVYNFYYRHYYLGKAPIRIHVNGSRGKSDVTRLIAAGLRSTGLKVQAKTTGTLPRLIDNDGQEVDLKRKKAVNIREQMAIIKRAVQANYDILILECMAIMPELQWVSGHKMIAANINIITNARLDHLDVMGRDSTEVAKTLALTISSGGKVFTADLEHSLIFSQVARERGAIFYCITEDSFKETIDWERFQQPYFKENVILALAVCKELGIDTSTALEEMYSYQADPAAFRIYKLNLDGKTIFFANAFAANDPESTKILYDKAYRLVSPLLIVALYNHRADRLYRWPLFLKMLKELNLSSLIWTGDKKIFKNLHKLSLSYSCSYSLRQLLKAIRHCPDQTLIFAFGNIKGIGLELSEWVKLEGELIC